MKNLSRVVITGGGTGGHFYPALAVAQEIRERNPKGDILFVGKKKGIEAKSAPKAGFKICFIPSAGFSKNPINILKFGFFNSCGIIRGVSILLKNKPQVVIGSGGFVSFPVLMAAKILNIPYIILEQNVLPGKVNRLMARWAKKIMATFEASKKYIDSKNFIVTGNPIRKDIIYRRKEEACNILSINPSKFTLLVTGASQGARSINNALIKGLPLWKDKEWQILHLVGRKNFKEVKNKMEPIIKDFKGDYRCIDYTEDMASMYRAANLVVARAGASTLAEINVCGLPSILVPYPYAADNHQEKNARWIEKTGGAEVILDNMVEDSLGKAVLNLASNKNKLNKMGLCSKSLGEPEALKKIVDEIEKI